MKASAPVVMANDRVSAPKLAPWGAAQASERNPSPPDHRRILIITGRELRHVVLTEPTIRALAGAWRDASITLLVDRPHAEIATLMSHVDAVLTVARWTNLLNRCRALIKVRKARFTHVLDLRDDWFSAHVTRVSGAYERRALVFSERSVSAFSCYTHRITPRVASGPIGAAYMDVLPPAVFRAELSQPQLHPLSGDRQWARDFIRGLLGSESGEHPFTRTLLVHLGAREENSGYPTEWLLEIICRARAELDLTAVLVGGGGDREQLNRIVSATAIPVAVAPTPISLRRWAALAAEVGLVLCHEGDAMHVAAAAGAQVIAVFSNDKIAQWGPLGWGHAILSSPAPDAGRGVCVSPEAVLSALRERRPPPSPSTDKFSRFTLC